MCRALAVVTYLLSVYLLIQLLAALSNISDLPAVIFAPSFISFLFLIL